MTTQVWTTESLRAHIREHSNDPEDCADEALIWFVCVRKAHELVEACDLRDIAELFAAGQKATDIADVQEWLDVHNDRLEDEPDSKDGLPDALAEHFGWGD